MRRKSRHGFADHRTADLLFIRNLLLRRQTRAGHELTRSDSRLDLGEQLIGHRFIAAQTCHPTSHQIVLLLAHMSLPRSIAFGLLALTPVWLPAQDPALPIQPQVSADRPPWENPAIFAIGKEPARATG